MTTKDIATNDELREQHIEELEAEDGPDWAKSHQPGSASCHELLDRTALIVDNVENFVVAHPACVQNKEWFALAERAAAALHELYQKVGVEHLDQETT
ncbi:MAG: hypothetical protein ACR2FY_22660 [Pirellulaceae bacterium]